MRNTRRSWRLLLTLFATLALAVALGGCAYRRAASSQASSQPPAVSPSATPSTTPFSVSPAPSAKASASTIVFVRDDHIWTIDADGSHLRQLTSGSAQDFYPAWAPGRKTIAFVRRTEKIWRPAVVLVRFGGGAARVLHRDVVPGTASSEITGFAYAPNGRQIAFADSYGSYSQDGYRVVILDLKILDLTTGKTKVILKRANGFDSTLSAGWSLSWSPDGKTLLVAQYDQDDAANETWMLDVKSRRLRRLNVANALGASWSPDGKSILVSTSTQTSSSILLVKPDGTVLRTLARGDCWLSGKPWVGDASFSSNGAMIAYVVSLQSRPRLWLMRVNGSGKHMLTKGYMPAWR